MGSAILNGILMGSIYGLTAIGLTLIFGVLKVINFAQGAFLMLGLFSTYWFVELTGANPYLALIFVVPFTYFTGYYTQKFLIKPVFESEKDVREPIGVIIVTTGIWYMLDNLALMLFGAEYRTINVPSLSEAISFFGLYAPLSKIIGFFISITIAGALFWFLKYSKMGKAIRATSQDREAASLMGINQYKIYNVTFGIGIAICGIAGTVLLPFYYVYPTAGMHLDILDFVIVVLGGLGSIPGALVGGLIIGLIESVGSQFISYSWTIEIIYLLFLVILFVKPEGLFGVKGEF
ncbi:MAG: branched-chain amino acid ABC transporter permease [Epsilonproteobacteria bacterium]|nr:branched-chain amino acid ABC transporter permease [Campylobacterota bacterium]